MKFCWNLIASFSVTVEQSLTKGGQEKEERAIIDQRWRGERREKEGIKEKQLMDVDTLWRILCHEGTTWRKVTCLIWRTYACQSGAVENEFLLNFFPYYRADRRFLFSTPDSHINSLWAVTNFVVSSIFGTYFNISSHCVSISKICQWSFIDVGLLWSVHYIDVGLLWSVHYIELYY